MREMKDSGIEWVGQIPKDWDVVPHKRIMHKVKKICEQYSGEDIISLTMNGVIKRDLTAGGKMPTSFDGYQYVKPNDLLLCLFDIDVTPRCVGVVKDYGVTSPAYSRFVMHDGYYNAYYDYLLRAIDDDKAFVHLSKNLRSSLTESDFGAIKTCVPSLAEQERIAAFLDAECAEIDAVLEKTRASIEEYKKLKQAVITQAVTKGVRGDRPMKDSGIEWVGEIANEFAVYKFKYLLKTPMQYGANEAGITFDKTLPRYIRITDITSDGRLKQDNRLCIEDTVAKPYILQDGDLLFARSGGTVGKSFLYKQSYGNAAFAGYLIRAVVNRTIAVPEYVYYYTNSSIYDTWKNSIFIQSTIQNIGADRYSNMPIIVPNNIEEQRSIVEYLNERCVGIDALIRKKQQYLTEIENYKKSLIYEYVTGKKEVV